MADFLLELLSEEIPARMQEKACADLARLFEGEIAKAGLAPAQVETYATPRRLALIARELPAATQAVREETKGPKASAPPQALEGFLRKTGLAREQLTERDGVLFAVVEKPGRATADVLAEAIPAIVRAFPWPKSMRWGAASASPSSLRWVRPLKGIVALLDETVVPFEIDGIASGASTVGHRFHHPGAITIGSAADYAEKLRACHVILDPAERRGIIEGAARALAEAQGLHVVPDAGLVAENAGLTEWPVPLLGDFDPAFLDVPREVIQLTMRTNQKYFALVDGAGKLAPNFICTANIAAVDGGAAIVAGNRKVLAARLSDAKFFWEQDLKVPLGQQAEKLDRIVFHEKLGTVADKVERVARLARWLVEEGIVGQTPSPHGGEGRGEGDARDESARSAATPGTLTQPSPSRERALLADMAEQAARLAKADLVTGMVGEFPELQGVMGGYYAAAEGLPREVSDAIRDHYKPVGQGDDVPTAPVTVAVSLADKLDTLFAFFLVEMTPTGSRDPYALRRAALGALRLIIPDIRLRLFAILSTWVEITGDSLSNLLRAETLAVRGSAAMMESLIEAARDAAPKEPDLALLMIDRAEVRRDNPVLDAMAEPLLRASQGSSNLAFELLDFFADRLKVQQREAGVRHDLIDAVFALGGEDDLVRLLARVKALQAFVAGEDGANLLAGYKRAANILKKEGWETSGSPAQAGALAESAASDPAPLRPAPDHGVPAYDPEPAEAALRAALDAAEPTAEAAIAAEDFEGAMAALATLRGPIDAFFESVTVNDADPAKRAARLALLARMRAAVHRVADFSKIEG
ncbi:glycine--tRNA ligase subunit beta [Sphingomonas nostoxanthinifaciens]|uniref:glycine--tRNA ligase subunit beta n=1 Tax=Sphingomonas nostoxanthinifaciens TaxID=2872652 RepID=UPI001CC1FB3D|nr:glycine--tRNA ligase subunit beta [Sphingomonas nostoxanthinifaciens]UAK24968.1 glycine--tRNA ligase subunit beta [Sphingomonas nostoxanthinifaciens]